MENQNIIIGGPLCSSMNRLDTILPYSLGADNSNLRAKGNSLSLIFKTNLKGGIYRQE